MALSNWDTLAFGPEGTAITAVFALHDEPEVNMHIRKNWIDVEHPGMWVPDGSFTEHVICRIYYGNVTIAKFHIETIKDDGRQSIFVLAHESVLTPHYHRRFFAGIGCYGFDGDSWIGVTPPMLEDFWAWMESHLADEGEDSDYATWLKTCRAAKALRYNQGDEYLTTKLGLEIPRTEPGQAEEPVLMKGLKGDHE